MQPCVQAHKCRLIICGSKLRLPTEENQEWMDIADEDATAGAHDPAELGNRSANIGKMNERQRADGAIYGTVVQRKGREIALAELRAGKLSACLGQHRGRSIDTYDAMTSLGQICAVATGAAGGVENEAWLERTDERPHSWFFDRS